MYWIDTDLYQWSEITQISAKRLPTNSMRPHPHPSHILSPASSYIEAGWGLPRMCERVFPPNPTEEWDTFLLVAVIELQDGRAFLVASEDGEAPPVFYPMPSYRTAVDRLSHMSLWWSF